MGSAWDSFDNDRHYDPSEGYKRSLAAKQREIDTLKYERVVEEMAKQHYTLRVTIDEALDGKPEWECGKCGCPVVNTETHNKVCPGRRKK